MDADKTTAVDSASSVSISNINIIKLQKNSASDIIIPEALIKSKYFYRKVVVGVRIVPAGGTTIPEPKILLYSFTKSVVGTQVADNEFL